MMEGKATAEEQAAKSALGRRLQIIRRKFRQGRADESGLTTLEWLLIVAAVAGLAALAVVLVQNVVDETAQEISGSSARKTAAKVSAANVIEESKNADPTDDRFNTWAKWDNYFTAKCNRIGVTFADADVTVAATFAPVTLTAPATVNDTAPTTAQLVTADKEIATAAKPQVICTAT